MSRGRVRYRRRSENYNRISRVKSEVKVGIAEEKLSTREAEIEVEVFRLKLSSWKGGPKESH